MADDEEDYNESRRLLPNSSDTGIISSLRTPPILGSVPSIPGGCPHKSEMSAPVDRFNIVYIIFYILGLGTLLPWNFFITANDYWMFKLRTINSTISPTSQPITSDINGTLVYNSTSGPSNFNQLQSLFQNALSICAMLPNVLFQILNTLLQQRIKERTRILGSITVMILLFVLTEVFVKIDTNDWQMLFFAITLVSVVVLNSCSAVFQSSLFGFAAGLPFKYVQAVMAGQGMGGVFAACAMILSLTVTNDPSQSAFAFFLTAMAVLALNGICYVFLSKNKFFLYFHKQKAYRNGGSGKDVDEEKLRSDPINDHREDDYMLEKNDDVWKKRSSLYGSDDTDKLEDKHSVKIKTVPPVWFILKMMWVHCFAIAFTFFVTLASFPSIAVSVISMSENSQWRTVYFTPVTCFLLFNLTDWLGRTLAGHLHVPSERNVTALLVCVLLRGAFPVLFAFCNAQPRSAAVLFGHDAYFIVFMVLFGLSNGHLSTLAMQYGPKRVEPEYAATAGSLLSLIIAIGLAAGAGFSFVIKMAIA